MKSLFFKNKTKYIAVKTTKEVMQRVDKMYAKSRWNYLVYDETDTTKVVGLMSKDTDFFHIHILKGTEQPVQLSLEDLLDQEGE